MGALFKKRGKWFIDYYAPNGQRIRKSVSKYKETANLALKKIEIEIAEGKYLDVKKCSPVSFRDFSEKFRKKHVERRNRSVNNQVYLLNALANHFGKRLLHEVSREDIDAYLQQKEQSSKPGTVNKHLTMIKSMFARANEWGDLNGYNPARDIKKLTENNERCRYLTDVEKEKLISACSGMMRLVVLVALKTGLRKGELLALKWAQAPQSNYVDFEHNTIFIHESLSKSKKSRYVPLAPTVKQALMDFPQYAEQGYVFVNPKTGKPLVNLKRAFLAALKKAEINDLRFHDLRHCFASDLVRKGVDLYVVQQLLGHSSPKMTQRYAHLGNSHLRTAICTLDEKKSNFFDFGHQQDTNESVVIATH